jgi:hypothetical protein
MAVTLLRGRGNRSIYIPCTTLLDLGDVELEQAVEPCDELLSVFEMLGQSRPVVVPLLAPKGPGMEPM